MITDERTAIYIESLSEPLTPFLEELEASHFSDKQIIKLLRIDAEQLKLLRDRLQERRAVATAD